METIKTINTDLAALHGYLCADGYIISHKKGAKKKFYKLGLRNTEKKLLEDFQSKLNAFFGLNSTITDEFDRVYKSSKEVYALLTNTFGSFYCREWNFPRIFNTLELKSSWLRAVFDCEWWVYVRKGIDRRIGVEMVNLDGMKSIKYLLQELGIKTRVRARKNGKIFVLYIFGKENLIKFSEKIGFLHPKKKLKLQRAIDSYQNLIWEFPTEKALLKKFVLNKLKGKSGKIDEKRIIICSSLRINPEKLRFFLNGFFKINSLVSKKQFNGLNTPYFQLSINCKKDVKKIHSLTKS